MTTPSSRAAVASVAALNAASMPDASDEPPLISADMHPPVDLAEDLERFNARIGTYLKPEEIARVGAAYVFSDAAHRGQMRLSGAPYISHPLAVAETLAGWHLDPHAVIAALLHDVMEDTSITKEQIAERFGKVAAELVDGVSKLDRIEHQSFEEAQAENFRKMLLAMARDVRVILIKLADRLHNMQTLDAMRVEKRRRIARETLDIYAPIANRLGLNALYRELQELAFRHAHPLRYRVLAKAVKGARGNRREVVSKILGAVRAALPEAGIDAEVMGREKHLYGIYRKMRDKHLSFSQVLDIYGFRIIVKDRPTCYLALGALHALYQPVPGKFKDYIAIPKANGYQSLYTTLIGPYGMPLEVQIRTCDMHHVAQDGVASHWIYKTERNEERDLPARSHLWLQSLLDLQKGSGDSREFLEHVKVDLYPDEVYVFTPKGKILALPRGATCVDFAYAVHTAVGDCCVAAKVNQQLVPLRTELNNGDRIDISTAAHANPNPAWLSFVKTARARSKIRHFLKTRQHDEAVRLGERFLDQSLRPLGGTLGMIGEGAWDLFKGEVGAKSRSEVLAAIGLGQRNPALDARRLMVLGHFEPIESGESVALAVTGEESAALQFGPCCRPILGDAIVGVVNQGYGIVIHAQDCPLLKRQRPDADRLVDVEWDVTEERMFDVNIIVEVKNSRGVLASVAAAIASAASNIHNVNMDEKRAEAVTTLKFSIEVLHRKHLAQVVRNVRKVPEVMRVIRERGARR